MTNNRIIQQVNESFIREKILETISSFDGKIFEERLETKKCTIVYWMNKLKDAGINTDWYLTRANEVIKNKYGEEKCIKM